MIYTLTINPSLDYVTKVKELHLGEVNRSYEEDIFAGGKGINVSTILQRLKQPTIALGFLAGFTGKEIEKKTKEAGINTEFIYVDDGVSRINIKIKSKEETEINGGGPQIDQLALEKLFSILSKISAEDVLVLAGSIQSTLPSDLYLQIMNHVKENNCKVVIDTTGETLLKTLPLKPFLIKPNIHELEEVVEKKLTSLDEIEEAARKMQILGAKNVLVSCGKDGALLVSEVGDVYHQKAPVGTVINSTGAGDSMVAGFITGYLGSNQYAEALKMGVACGSATAFSLDLASLKKIQTVYKSLERENKL